MANGALIDPCDYPLDRVLFGPEEFGRFNPQRHEFHQLTSVLHLDTVANLIVASRVVGPDEWWMAGHIPGRPLFPGVLQVESMAQAASVHTHVQLELPEGTFLAFAGMDDFRFRRSVGPDTPLWIAGKILQFSRGRGIFRWTGQMMDAEARIVASGKILGVVA